MMELRHFNIDAQQAQSQQGRAGQSAGGEQTVRDNNELKKPHSAVAACMASRGSLTESDE